MVCGTPSISLIRFISDKSFQWSSMIRLWLEWSICSLRGDRWQSSLPQIYWSAYAIYVGRLSTQLSKGLTSLWSGTSHQSLNVFTTNCPVFFWWLERLPFALLSSIYEWPLDNETTVNHRPILSFILDTTVASGNLNSLPSVNCSYWLGPCVRASRLLVTSSLSEQCLLTEKCFVLSDI